MYIGERRCGGRAARRLLAGCWPVAGLPDCVFSTVAGAQSVWPDPIRHSVTGAECSADPVTRTLSASFPDQTEPRPADICMDIYGRLARLMEGPQLCRH